LFVFGGFSFWVVLEFSISFFWSFFRFSRGCFGGCFRPPPSSEKQWGNGSEKKKGKAAGSGAGSGIERRNQEKVKYFLKK